mmetsp:Transcript_36177/g.85018  ORF Transcript_36177/g.85018 Transcript_36177/m.85018 type:complete len:289 (-) Transcript_36177:126-992(-)
MTKPQRESRKRTPTNHYKPVHKKPCAAPGSAQASPPAARGSKGKEPRAAAPASPDELRQQLHNLAGAEEQNREREARDAKKADAIRLKRATEEARKAEEARKQEAERNALDTRQTARLVVSVQKRGRVENETRKRLPGYLEVIEGMPKFDKKRALQTTLGRVRGYFLRSKGKEGLTITPEALTTLTSAMLVFKNSRFQAMKVLATSNRRKTVVMRDASTVGKMSTAFGMSPTCYADELTPAELEASKFLKDSPQVRRFRAAISEVNALVGELDETKFAGLESLSEDDE